MDGLLHLRGGRGEPDPKGRRRPDHRAQETEEVGLLSVPRRPTGPLAETVGWAAQFRSTPWARARRRAMRSWIGGVGVCNLTTPPAATRVTLNETRTVGLPDVQRHRRVA